MPSNPPVTPSDQSDLEALKGKLPLIGLTGGIGSGKTAVSTQLSALGAGIVDTDLIAHQITAPHGKAIPRIAGEFGADFIDSSGALDRAKMRTLVFANPHSRLVLEQITHPLIREETITQARSLVKQGHPYIVFVVPLLVESSSWRGLIDHLVVVDCPKETQINRVMQRSNLSRLDVERILNAQASRQERLSYADTIIENNGNFEELTKEVLLFHQKILDSAKGLATSS
jgi:dephospho-CoA kinase